MTTPFTQSVEARDSVDITALLYETAFDRTPEDGGLDVQVSALEGGLSASGLAANLVGSAEFQSVHTGDEATTIESFYENVLGRHAEDGAVATWMSLGLSLGDILEGIALSPESQEHNGGALHSFENAVSTNASLTALPLETFLPFELNSNATLDQLGQKPPPAPPEMLNGTGIPVTGGSGATDTLTGTQLWMRPDLRGGAPLLPTSVDLDGTVHYQGPAGSDPGNSARGAVALQFAALSGVNGFENNQIKLFLDTDPNAGTSFRELDLQINSGVQEWVPVNFVGNPIADDPQAHPGSVAENSANMMFGYWLGGAAPPPIGQYDVIMTETSKVGTMTNHIVIHLV